jgi:hypothetical protein
LCLAASTYAAFTYISTLYILGKRIMLQILRGRLRIAQILYIKRARILAAFKLGRRIMSKKLIAILCAVMLPVSMAFADLTSDLAGGADAATALTNEVMAVMAADPSLSADEAKDIASQNLVAALVAAGSTPSAAAATATEAGATESVAYAAAGAPAPSAPADSAPAAPAAPAQNAGNTNSTPAGGEPGSGQEDETEDNSYGEPA